MAYLRCGSCGSFTCSVDPDPEVSYYVSCRTRVRSETTSSVSFDKEYFKRISEWSGFQGTRSIIVKLINNYFLLPQTTLVA